MDSATCAMTSPLPMTRRDGVSGAAPVARSGRRPQGASAQRGRETEQDTSGQRHAHREQQHAEIELRLNLDVRRHARHAPRGHDPHQRISPEVGEHNAEQAAGRGEQQRFGQQLPHQAEPAGAERDAHRHLALPRRAARQQQRRHAGTGQQQQQADDRHQRQQRPRVDEREPRHARGRRDGVDRDLSPPRVPRDLLIAIDRAQFRARLLARHPA
jgi:hypothetical protein